MTVIDVIRRFVKRLCSRERGGNSTGMLESEFQWGSFLDPFSDYCPIMYIIYEAKCHPIHEIEFELEAWSLRDRSLSIHNAFALHSTMCQTLI